MNKHEYAKLLNFWSPPPEAGDPIGCIATTFTFESSFFENECLARFIGMESDPDSDGPVYLIELEEKLAGLKCASIIVDQHHCDGKRSLRWDLIPFRLRQSILHAKISLLCWANAVRIIIASANLTNDGYRRNQEIFGVIDIFDGVDIPPVIYNDIITYLASLIDKIDQKQDLPETQRMRSFFEQVENILETFQFPKDSTRRHKDIVVLPVLIKPDKTNLFEQIRTAWSNYSGPPKKAQIISPFFDPAESENLPTRKIWHLLSQRGQAKVTYGLTYEQNLGKDDQILLHGPESLTYKPASRVNVHVEFRKIEEQLADEKSKIDYRPLHQKSLWLESEDWAGYLIGSSNFTSAGTGLSKSPNYEANLFYMLSKKRNSKEYQLLQKRHLRMSSLEKGTKIQWLQKVNLDEPDDKSSPILPKGFGTIHLNQINGNQYLILKFIPRDLSQRFQIYDERDESLLYSEGQWLKERKPMEKQILWELNYFPSGVYVSWDNIDRSVWWPINVLDFSVLPPPAELKDLPLEILINIISSSRPLHHVLRRWLHKKKYVEEKGLKPELDPHKKVDVSSFLLQRTRKISYALNALKFRLERPVFTQETLNWRLYGPVGVKALVKAILKEAKSEEEKAFLIAEIALELSGVYPTETTNSLNKTQIRQEFRKIIRELFVDLKKESKVKDKAIKTYVKESFKKALHEF